MLHQKKRDFQTFISVIISQNFSCLHVWVSIVWLLSQRENTANAKYECCMPVWEIVNRLWKSGMWTPAGVETVTWSVNAAWGSPVITGFVKLYLVAFTVNRNPVTWNLAAEQGTYTFYGFQRGSLSLSNASKRTSLLHLDALA